MKAEVRQAIAAATALGALLGTAAVTEYMRADAIAKQEQAAPEPTPDMTIDLGVLPNQAPPAVLNRVHDAVSVHILGKYKDKKGELFWGDGSASGVQIAQDLFVTAGHAILEGNNKLVPGTQYCGNVSIGEQVSVDGSEFYGASGAVIEKSGSYSSSPKTNTPDVALLYQGKFSNQGLPPITVPLATATPGETLYAVNFEPTASDKARDPDIDYGHPNKAELPYANPAIYGGVVLATLADGSIVVADGLKKSYGVLPDDHTRRGASGGGEYNRAGQLVGITVAAVDDPVSRKYILDVYRVALKNAPKQVRLSIVQPVTRKLLADLVPPQRPQPDDCIMPDLNNIDPSMPTRHYLPPAPG